MENFSYPTLEPFNFLGLENQDYQNATVAILPVPYSSTASWKTGTNEGPRAIINASRYVELYDIESQRDFSAQGIFTLPFLGPSKNSPEETIGLVKGAIGKILGDGKLPIMLGGEHSITLGAIQAAKERFENLSILQIDAHADLRNEYEGSKFSHASVMRRVVDLGVPITQVGIRHISQEEADYIRESRHENIFCMPDLPIDKIVASLSENVYITFDLDGLDPSIMPATGTPEPGGLRWYETLQLIKEVAKQKKIVGADVVELDPIPGMAAPDFLAAKLVYKIIGHSI